MAAYRGGQDVCRRGVALYERVRRSVQADGALGVHRGGALQKRLLGAASCRARDSPIQLCWAGTARGLWPACVFEMQLRQIQPARCWSSYIGCCPNLGWDGALLTPFTPNPPTSNPRSSAPGDELRNENKIEDGTECYTADVISLEQMVLLGAQGLPLLL